MRIAYKSRAFSLIEMVIAIMLLSVLSVVMVGIIPSAVFGVYSASKRATASNIAQDVIEAARHQSPSSLEDYRFDTNQNNTDYLVRVSFGSATDSEGKPLDTELARTVRVHISWNDRNFNRNFQVQTTMFKPQ